MARSYSITYGSLTIDGSAGVHLHAGEDKSSPLRYSMRHDGGQVDCTTVVIAASPSALASAVDSLIGLVRTPRQDLTVTLGGTTKLKAKPSDNSGFDTEGTATKVGDPWDNGCSQRVDISWSFGLPANKASLNGRRESDVTVEADGAGRRTVTISGIYTALGNKSATEQYTDAAPTYFTAVLDDVDDHLNFEQVRESKNYFETDKELRFSVVFLEILEPQLGQTGTPNQVSINEQNFDLAVRRVGQDDSPDQDVKRLYEATGSYTCKVPDGQDIDAAVLAIKAYVTARVIAAPELAGALSRALVSDDSRVNKDSRDVAVTQTWNVALTASFLQFRREETTEYDPGVILRRVWSATRWRRRRYFAPESCSLTVVFTTLYNGQSSRQPATVAPFAPLTSPPEGATWERVGPISQSRTEIKRGQDEHVLDLLQATTTVRYEAAAVETGFLAS